MLLEDVRFALRVLRNNRAFTAVAILSLALGIGATSAMFSFADALLLRPLPVLRPSEVAHDLLEAIHERFRRDSAPGPPVGRAAEGAVEDAPA